LDIKANFPTYPPSVNPFENADLAGSKDFVKNLHQRNFLLRDVGISSYLFNQWKNYGLIDIPLSAQGRKWVTLNFGEYLWLKIINDLRKLGCALEDIKRVKERYMIDPFRQLVQQNQKEVFNQIFWAAAKQYGNQTEEQLEAMKRDLGEISPIDLLSEVFPRPMNLFEGCILNMIATRSEAYLILFLPEYFRQQEPEFVPPDNVETETKKKRKVKPSGIEFGLFSEEFKRIDPNIAGADKIFEAPHINVPMRV